jgi:O-antigen ligase
LTQAAAPRPVGPIGWVTLGLVIGLPLILTALLLRQIALLPNIPINKMSLDSLYAQAGSAIELIIFVAALVRGFRPIKALANQPLLAGLAVMALLLIAFGTARLVAVDPPTAVFMSVLWVIHLLFGLSVGWLAQNAWPQNTARIWAAFVAALVFYIAIIAVYVARIKSPETYDWETLGVGVFNVRGILFYLVPGYGAALALTFSAKTRTHSILSVFAASLMFAAICWSGTRSAAASCVIVPLIAIGLISSLRARKFIGAFALSLILGGALSLIQQPPSPFYGIFYRVASNYDDKDQSSGRLEIWQATIASIRDKPIFGHGDQRLYASIPRFQTIHPHNSILQIALYWGLAGTVLFFGLIGWLWARILRNTRRDPAEYLPAFLVLNGLLFTSMLDGSLFWPHPIMVAAFAAALGLATPREV